MKKDRPTTTERAARLARWGARARNKWVDGIRPQNGSSLSTARSKRKNRA